MVVPPSKPRTHSAVNFFNVKRGNTSYIDLVEKFERIQIFQHVEINIFLR